MIHEMAELITSGLGQYAHGNQPSHHVPYLYNFTDSSWKTAPLVRRIGDENTGSLGSWYAFTALGLYPVAPGTPIYALGAPRFPRARVTLENGRVLTIEAPGIEETGAIYLQSVSLDGERLTTPFIQHERLV